MFIYKQLNSHLHAELKAKGYKYLWFDGYMNYAPTDTGERLDIRRIVPLKEISPEIQEAMELARMLHQQHGSDATDLLTEALTQDEVYPIDYFKERLDGETRPADYLQDERMPDLGDEADWYVEVEI